MKDDDDDIIKYFDLNYCILNRTSNLLYIIVREFKKLLLRCDGNENVTEKQRHISSRYSAKQQREMTKFKVLCSFLATQTLFRLATHSFLTHERVRVWRTKAHNGKFFLLCLNLNAVHACSVEQLDYKLEISIA